MDDVAVEGHFYFIESSQLRYAVGLFLFLDLCRPVRYNRANDERGCAMTLHEGRPADEAGRLEKEIRVYDLLDSLHIPYQRIDHEAAMTMEACTAVDAALGATICKNLMLCNRQCTEFYLLLLPGDKPFKTKELSKQIGSSRLSFAAPEYMERFLDITPGSLSVLGLMNDKEKRVQLLIDEDILDGQWIGCHPCINTSSLRIPTKDMLEILIPAMGHPYCTGVLPWEET